MHRVGQVAGAPVDAKAWGRCQGLDIVHRCRRAVAIDDGNPEVADHGAAERPRQQGEGDEWHADHKEERQAVAPHPAQLTRCDKESAGTGWGLHCFAGASA